MRQLPIFKRTVVHYRGASEFHGAQGEWRVEPQRLGWEILDAFQAAAEEIGIARTEDFNRGDNEGSGKFEVNQRRGVRWSASMAFLRPVRHRPNLTVVTDALVRRLVLSGRRVTGVELERAGEGEVADGAYRARPGCRVHREPAHPSAVRHRARRAPRDARHPRRA